MKKVFVFGLLLSAVMQVQAQWGVKVGTTVSKFTADHASSGVGVYAGGFYDLRLIDQLYFRPQLMYSYDHSEADWIQAKTDFRLHYLKLPLTFSCHFQWNKNHSLNPYVGGYLSCGLLGRYVAKYPDGSQVKNTNVFDQVDRFNYGLIGGVEYEFGKHYLINVEYHIGLNNVRHYDLPGQITDGLKKMNNLLIGLGYKF